MSQIIPDKSEREKKKDVVDVTIQFWLNSINYYFQSPFKLGKSLNKNSVPIQNICNAKERLVVERDASFLFL